MGSRFFQLARVLPAMLLSAGCSDIERPQFGAAAPLVGETTLTTPAEPFYRLSVTIDSSAAPDEGPPIPLSRALYGAADHAGSIGLNSDADIRRWVSITGLNL